MKPDNKENIERKMNYSSDNDRIFQIHEHIIFHASEYDKLSNKITITRPNKCKKEQRV